MRAEVARGGSTRGDFPSLVRGFGGSPPRFFKIMMSVEAILMYFVTNFANEIRLIVQAFYLAIFKRVSTTTTKE